MKICIILQKNLYNKNNFCSKSLKIIFKTFFRCRELAADLASKTAELDGREKNIKNTEEAVMELKKSLNDRKNDIEKIKEEKI